MSPGEAALVPAATYLSSGFCAAEDNGMHEGPVLLWLCQVCLSHSLGQEDRFLKDTAQCLAHIFFGSLCLPSFLPSFLYSLPSFVRSFVPSFLPSFFWFGKDLFLPFQSLLSSQRVTIAVVWPAGPRLAQLFHGSHASPWERGGRPSEDSEQGGRCRWETVSVTGVLNKSSAVSHTEPTSGSLMRS